MLAEIVPTVSEQEAFTDIDVAFLVGSMPRREGMLRKDLLTANAKIFRSQGKSLDQYAKKTVKVSLSIKHIYTEYIVVEMCLSG